MSHPIIRPARADEYDEIGRVWMESWVSTGLGEASEFLLANLRARIRRDPPLTKRDGDGSRPAHRTCR
jgi:hypothetical protein